MVRRRAVFLQAFLNILAERPHVRIGRSAGDDEEVRHVGNTLEAQHHDVVRLVIQGDRRRLLRQLRAIQPYCLITQTLISGFTSA